MLDGKTMTNRNVGSVLDAFNSALLKGELQFVPPRTGLSGATGIEYLGSGESYDAYLLRSTAYELVLRVARRSPSELPRSVQQEVHGLQLDPTDIAPEPIAFLPGTDNTFGSVAVLTSFQRGARLPEDFPWSEENLEKLARTLARLHGRQYTWRGDPTDASARYPTLSLVDEFDEAHSWWQTSAPEICTAREVAELIGAAREYVASRSTSVAGLTRFSLVHGDLHQSNLLVDAHGELVLIDWEWVEVGDPAQDLASIGGSVACPPWYALLSPQALNHMLEVYADCSEQPLDLPALAERRNCWEVHERLWTSLHFRATGRPREAALLLQGVAGMVSRQA